MLVNVGVSSLRIQRVLNWGIVIFFSLIVFIPFGMFISSIVLYEFDFQGNARFSNSVSVEKALSLPDEGLLDSSFISLRGDRVSSLLLPEVARKLAFFENFVRPDADIGEEVYLIELKGSGLRRFVLKGERVFLNWLSGSEISFSGVETPFWFQVISKGENALSVELHVEFRSEKGDIFYSESQLVALEEIKYTEAFDGELVELSPIIAYLNGCKIFDPDILLELYGGESFKDVKGLYRIHSERNESPLYIKPGELFVWKEGRLVKEKLRSKDFPLILIKGIDNQKCEMVLWGREGFYSKTFFLPVTKVAPPSFKISESFLKLHQRTDYSATFQFLNRNSIIRKGDWILCSKDRFRNLRTFTELKECLSYTLKGELFIFDGIVKKEGLTFFTGSLFNEERTVVKKVEIAFSEPKKIAPFKKKETAIHAQGKNE